MLSLPNTYAGRLVNLSNKYSADNTAIDIIDFRDNIRAIYDTRNTNGVGLIIADPAVRLFRAYQAQKDKLNGEIDFASFYSNPVRRNFYSKCLAGIDISKLGYVGIDDCFYKSFMLLERWLNSRYLRIPYGELNHVNSIDLSAETLSHIKQLHAKDYELYNQALERFNCDWQCYVSEKSISISANKRVYIHLGPPKTGTSAIQSWLKRSSAQLNTLGIYYPYHKEDINGVSSGNFEHIVSFNNDNKAYFDDAKATALVSKFNASKHHTLLLSSEHFFYYLLWFFTRFPKARYLFYVRHPLSSLESGYHQEVKRHKRTSDFIFPNVLGFNNLMVVARLAKEFNVDITYRFYSDKLFEKGSIFSDFAANFRQFVRPPKEVKRLNTQYSPGALMLMRLCNQFADDKLLRSLDFWLQKDSEQIPNFSLISPELVSEANIQIKEAINQIASIEKNICVQKLTELANDYRLPDYCTKDKMEQDLVRVLKKISKQRPRLANDIIEQCLNKSADEVQQRLIPHLTLSVANRISLQVSDKIIAIKSTILKAFRSHFLN